MQITPQAVLFALATTAAAADMSTLSDLDGSVWQQQSPAPVSKRSCSKFNRPAKRQGGWNPPSELVTPLQEVWDHCLDTYTEGLFGFKNFGWDQLMATDGYVLPPIFIPHLQA